MLRFSLVDSTRKVVENLQDEETIHPDKTVLLLKSLA